MTTDEIQAFYAMPCVRRRIGEYLGEDDQGCSTCVYLAQPDSGWPRLKAISSPEKLSELLDHGMDLSRSMWDRHSLIAHLDIEYVNFEFADEPYIDRERTFELQKPVCSAAERILQQEGIDPLHLISGRGHHYVWRIPQSCSAFKQLQDIGRCNDSLFGRYRNPGAAFPEPVPAESGLAFAGLGLIMEYLAGQIKEEAAGRSSLPVELTAVAVGPGERGREMISIDVSEYGDPLHLRVIRVPFTAYLKRSIRNGGSAGSPNDVLLTSVAGHGIPTDRALAASGNLAEATALADKATTRIPDGSRGTLRLISAYRQSQLCGFHDHFYAQAHHSSDEWNATYDMMPMHILPPCVARILTHPNDLLMKPAGIELVVRAFLALGWHPRHIAGLIRSRYERDHGWGDQWFLHDAASRADFYTRIFAGLFATGVDDLLDFNCCSVREKGLCIDPQDGCTITEMRTALLERRRHGRLAHWPFNRLFLPHEHL